MRSSFRISIALTVIAAGAGGLLFLLSRTGLVRFDLLPVLLFSSVIIGSAFLLISLWIELPLTIMLHHGARGNIERLKSLAKVKNEYGRLAELLVRSSTDGSVRQHNAPDAPRSRLEAVYRDLVETAPDAILLLDGSGNLTFCNQQAGTLCGYASGSELCGKPFGDFIAPENRKGFEELVKRVTGTRQMATAEFTVKRKDTSVFAAEATLSGLVNDPADACSLFLRDISTRKKAEERKEALEQQLRAVYKMEALGQLANGIAHDLNNSLGAISGYIDLIKKMGGGDEERLQKYANTIASAAQRSARLIHHLLTFARKSRMQVASFDVNEVIADTVKLLETTIDKTISLVLELKAQDATITGDPGQLQNAIVNLAINARDAMPVGGSLTFSTANIFIDEAFAKHHSYKMTHGYYLAITVSDTGVGMDRKIRDHLFEPFFSTKESAGGSGLGLASVYGSVKSHHGYIEVESEPNRGSTFTMYLPISQAPRAEPVGGEPALPAPPRRRIMVVDDELSVREMLGELLTWLGFAVTVFGDPREAMDHYAAHAGDVDLAILDWKMPYLDGMECFGRMRTVNPSARALIATGYCIDSYRESFQSKGILGILPKPFVSADLAKAIADALA
jgi:two-component system, cell cycle sensor histidine kinase and response regulator CckA